MGISKDRFGELLKDKLGSLYQRAETVFDSFGQNLAFDVINVLLHAADQGEGKIEEVLEMLEKHFSEHLQYQHPDVRGTVCDSLGRNETQVMFLDICQRVLGLQPTTAG